MKLDESCALAGWILEQSVRDRDSSSDMSGEEWSLTLNDESDESSDGESTGSADDEVIDETQRLRNKNSLETDPLMISIEISLVSCRRARYDTRVTRFL
jgi:hypothetical protein